MRMQGMKVVAVGLLCASLGAAGVYAKGDAKKAEYTMVPAGSAKWNPIDPKQPKGGQVAFISGDPMTGPVTLMLKLPKGPSPMHWHSSDYSAVIIEGTAKHWLPGKEADAKANGPGTAWFQPGGSAATMHGDECTSDSCTIFIVMPGKFDMTAVPAKK
jgi:Domain of unknown function (DUF4437)